MNSSIVCLILDTTRVSLRHLQIMRIARGPTFRPTPNCISSDPSQKVLFARPLEYFKSIL